MLEKLCSSGTVKNTSAQKGFVMPQVRAVIYSRQSHNKNASIEEQIEACTEDCDELEWNLVRVYSDGDSASRFARTKKKARRDWAEILEELEFGSFDALVIWETSRADRKAASWMQALTKLREQGVLVRITSQERTFNVKNPADWKALATDGVDSEYESEKISLRLKRAMKSNARKGKPHARAPYGYRRIYNASDGTLREQVVDAVHRGTAHDGTAWSPAWVVQELFARTAAGSTLGSLATWLNSLGIPTPRQTNALDADRPEAVERWAALEWNAVTIRGILRNPVYRGIRQHGKKDVATECWPPLIEEEVFTAVSGILNDPERVTTVYTPSAKYLLSCVAKCAHCGSDMIFIKGLEAGSGGRGRPRPAGYRCRKSHSAATASKLEGYVIGVLTDWLANPATWANLRQVRKAAMRDVAKASAEIEHFREELRKIKEVLEDTTLKLDPIILATRASKLTAEMTDRQRVVDSVALPGALKPYADKSMPEVVTIFEGSTMAQRRLLIDTVLSINVRSVGKGFRNVPINARTDLVFRLDAS